MMAQQGKKGNEVLFKTDGTSRDSTNDTFSHSADVYQNQKNRYSKGSDMKRMHGDNM